MVYSDLVVVSYPFPYVQNWSERCQAYTLLSCFSKLLRIASNVLNNLYTCNVSFHNIKPVQLIYKSFNIHLQQVHANVRFRQRIKETHAKFNVICGRCRKRPLEPRWIVVSKTRVKEILTIPQCIVRIESIGGTPTVYCCNTHRSSHFPQMEESQKCYQDHKDSDSLDVHCHCSH